MMLIIHIVIALASLAYTTYLWASPSTRKFNASYALIGLTFASGVLLVIGSPVHMAQACLSGLVYTGAITLAMASAHGKMGRSRNQ